MQEERGLFQQADVGVNRSQFTLHGWAAAFLWPLEKAPKGTEFTSYRVFYNSAPYGMTCPNVKDAFGPKSIDKLMSPDVDCLQKAM
jgi:hypothetical protein